MKPSLLVLLILGVFETGLAQARPTLAVVLAEVAPLEGQWSARVPVVFSLVDARRFQTDTLPLTLLNIEFAGGHERVNEHPDSLAHAPVSLVVRFDYFGFERTEGGTWLSRASGSLFAAPGQGLGSRIEAVPISVERIIGRRRPSLVGSPEVRELVSAVSKAVLDSTQRIVGNSSGELRRVTAIGHAVASDLSVAAVEKATMSALQVACAKAWGVEIDAVSKVIDFRDVTTETLSRTRGVVRSYRLRKEQTRLTSDGHVVVVVDALIALPEVSARFKL